MKVYVTLFKHENIYSIHGQFNIWDSRILQEEPMGWWPRTTDRRERGSKVSLMWGRPLTKYLFLDM